METALQDIMPCQCFGCGALNERGLQIKSFWLGDEVVCAWRAQAHHIGHPGILYGGMIASVVDCHCIWTAVAWAHRDAGVEMDETPRFKYVTAALTMNFRKPVPIAEAIELRATVTDFSERKAIVRCLVTCTGQLCADAQVVAVPMRVPQAAADTHPARVERTCT